MHLQKISDWMDRFGNALNASITGLVEILTTLAWLIPLFLLHVPVFVTLGVALLLLWAANFRELRTKSLKKIVLVNGFLEINLRRDTGEPAVCWNADHPLTIIVLGLATLGSIVLFFPFDPFVHAPIRGALDALLVPMQSIAVFAGVFLVVFGLWLWRKRYTPTSLLRVVPK